MSDDRFVSVMTKLTLMRNTMSPDEQKVLDAIVCRTNDEDEVAAHQMVSKATASAAFSIAYDGQMYKVTFR